MAEPSYKLFITINFFGFLMMGCTASFDISKLYQTEKDKPNAPPTKPFVTAPAISKIKATLNSPGSLTLDWEKQNTSSEILGYRLSYQVGTTAPADCSSPNIDESVLTTNTINLPSLSAGEVYSFRICSVTEDEISNGDTLTMTTLPLCDYSVSAGSLDDGTAGGLSFTNTADGVDSYVEFNNFLAAADTAGDTNADGIVSICLENGLTVVTSTAYGPNYPQASHENMFIYANATDTVTFDDQRTGYNGKAGFRIAANNVSLANLNFQSTSRETSIIVISDANFITGITINSMSSLGPPGGELNVSAGSANHIHNISITTNCSNGAVYAIGTIDHLSNVTITGEPEAGIYYILYSPTAISNIRDIEINGASTAIYLEGARDIDLKNITATSPISDNSYGIVLINGRNITIDNFKFTTQSGLDFPKFSGHFGR